MAKKKLFIIQCVEKQFVVEGGAPMNIYASCDNRGGNASGSGGVISGGVSLLNEFQQAYFN